MKGGETVCGKEGRKREKGRGRGRGERGVKEGCRVWS